MSDMVQQKNILALITPRVASAFAAPIAGGAGNGVAVVGAAFQRSLIGMPLNAAIVIAFAATLSATKSLGITAVVVQHSVDGVNWTNFQTFTDPGVVASAAGANSGQIALQAYLEGANDYVRVGFIPTLSNNATDTATVVALLIFAGASRLPAAA